MRAGLAATAVGLSGCLAAPPGSTATPSEDAGGEPDAAPGAIPACAQPTLVTDDFGDMVALPGFAVARSGTATVTMDGSAAVFDLGSSGSATLASYRAFSLDEAATFVEVVTPPDDDGEAGFSFVAAHDEGNSVAFKIQGGKLVAQYQLDAADPQPVKTISFDPVNHRWLRLREEGETMYWESSPDGGAYTPFAEAPSVVPLTYVRIQFYGTSDPSGVAGGPVTVDNFNGGGPPIGSWCKAASFAADFEDPVATEVWAEALDPGCAVSHLGGELLFELAAGMDGSCHRVARPRFDLTGSSAGVEIVEPIDASEDAIASLRLYADPGNWLEMRVGAGILKVVKVRAGSSSAPWMDDFSPVAHGRWRIREDGGVVYFETHDGTAWVSRYEMDDPFDLTAVELRLSVLVLTAPLTASRTVRFDDLNVNLPP